MSKIEYGRIIEIENDELKLLNKKPKKFWKGAKFLGEYAFENCKELKEIVIPKSIVMSYENPFLGCETLERIFVEEGNEGLSTDGRSLFYSDGKFLISYANLSGQHYEIPNHVLIISAGAFKGCRNLKKVEISENVQMIGWGAFENTGITEILIPKTVKNIECDAFNNCKKLKEIKIETDNGILSVEPGTFNQILENGSKIEHIVAEIIRINDLENQVQLSNQTPVSKETSKALNTGNELG